jgi:hypothetical protein
VNPLTLLAYPGDSGTTATSFYYEDDGTTFDYEQGAVFKRFCTLSTLPTERILNLSSPEGTYLPTERRVVIEFIDVSHAPLAVFVDGTRIVNPPQGVSGSILWQFDARHRRVSVTMKDQRKAVSVSIRLR